MPGSKQKYYTYSHHGVREDRDDQAVSELCDCVTLGESGKHSGCTGKALALGGG